MKRLDSYTCPEWEEKLIAGHLNDQSSAEHIALKEHLRHCSACANAYEDYLTVGVLLENLPFLEPTCVLSPELLLESDAQQASHSISLWRNKLPSPQSLYGHLIALTTLFHTAYSCLLGSISYQLRVSRRAANALAVAYVMLAALFAGGFTGIIQTVSGGHAPVQPASQPLFPVYTLTVSPESLDMGVIYRYPQQSQLTLSNNGWYSLIFTAQTNYIHEATFAVDNAPVFSTFPNATSEAGVIIAETELSIDLSPSSGTIPPGGSTRVTVTTNTLDYDYHTESSEWYISQSYIFQIGIQSNGGNKLINGSFDTGQHSSCIDSGHVVIRGPGNAQLIGHCQKNDAYYLCDGSQCYLT